MATTGDQIAGKKLFISENLEWFEGHMDKLQEALEKLVVDEEEED